MSRLTVSSLCWVHKIVTVGWGVNSNSRGKFRTLQSWIGSADGGMKIENAIYVPPAPEHIFDLVVELLNWWADTYLDLRGAPKDEICQGLAQLHHRLVAIHPFLDGNGRVARVLLDLGLDELLGAGLSRSFFEEPQEYYEVLRAADLGNLRPLADRIQACAI
jgi:Fic family protein